MALSDATLLAAYARSGGRCECTEPHAEADAPHHDGRCKRTFLGREYWRPLYADDTVGQDGIAIYCITCYRLATADERAVV